jgi:O-antigen/teichoic acid export membrane protein
MKTPSVSSEDTIVPLQRSLQQRLANSPRLLPDMFWTFSNNVVAVGSGLIVFKIISRWIPAGEYGKASLVLGVVGLLNQLIAGPAILAHLRLYFEHAREGRGDSYSRAVLRLLIWISMAMSAIYIVIAGVNVLLSNRIYWYLALPAVLLLFMQTQQTGTFAFLEAQKRYRAMTIAQSAGKALQVPFLIALIYVGLNGPASVVSSQMLAAASVVLVWAVWPRMKAVAEKEDSAFTVSGIYKSAALIFGWSFYLFNLFGWVLATSDRYIIEHYRTVIEVGIYALNYGLWSVPYLSANAWLETLVRSRLFERAEANDWAAVRKLVRDRTALAIALGAIMTVVIYFGGKWVAFHVIGEKYWHSTSLMMLICVGHFFYMVAASFHGMLQALKRVGALVWIAGVTSALNFCANLLLVPQRGIIGAAWSTCAAYIAMCLITLAIAPVLMLRAQTNGGIHKNA